MVTHDYVYSWLEHGGAQAHAHCLRLRSLQVNSNPPLYGCVSYGCQMAKWAKGDACNPALDDHQPSLLWCLAKSQIKGVHPR